MARSGRKGLTFSKFCTSHCSRRAVTHLESCSHGGIVCHAQYSGAVGCIEEAEYDTTEMGHKSSGEASDESQAQHVMQGKSYLGMIPSRPSREVEKKQ